jgi:hypothetical protein
MYVSLFARLDAGVAAAFVMQPSSRAPSVQAPAGISSAAPICI